jgi:predicted O-methyltransferase YrrM
MNPPVRSTQRAEALLAEADTTEGFLSPDEGRALMRAATRAARANAHPLLEVGSYLGRSALYLAAGLCAAGDGDAVLFSIDHHHGSEEMQAGWEHHDASLVDSSSGRMDSLPRWRARIDAAGAEDLVVGVIGDSARIAANWTTPLGFVFIDGGHGDAVAWADYREWSAHIAPGGLLLFHDVFADPADGGRPPYECYLDAISSGRFVERPGSNVGSLRELTAI